MTLYVAQFGGQCFAQTPVFSAILFGTHRSIFDNFPGQFLSQETHVL